MWLYTIIEPYKCYRKKNCLELRLPLMSAHLGLTKIAFRDCCAITTQRKTKSPEQLERKPWQTYANSSTLLT